MSEIECREIGRAIVADPRQTTAVVTEELEDVDELPRVVDPRGFELVDVFRLPVKPLPHSFDQ